MSQETPAPKIEVIDVDLDASLILQIIQMKASALFTPASYSIVEEALEDPDKDIYEALGQAMFNEWMIDALKEGMAHDLTKIRIGEEEVMVPPEYVQAEKNYCHEELVHYEDLFKADEDCTGARQDVLDKRLQFYNLWKAGKVEL